MLTETFIEAHAHHLRPPVVRLFGNPIPITDEDGRFVVRWAGPLGDAVVRLAGPRHQRRLRSFLLTRDLSAAQGRLARFLKRRGVAAVLAEYGPTASNVAPACAAAGVPLIAHFHGYDAYSHAVVDAHHGYRDLFAAAAAVIAVSQHMRERLTSLGAPSEKLHLVHYGVDTTVLPRSSPETRPEVFIAVGRFVEKKAPHLTILAFAEMARRRPHATLRMVGDGPLIGACRSLVIALGLQHRIELVGPVDHSRIPELLTQARCFVQHSVTAGDGDSEGTPVAVTEAMAAGLPVVATRHGGIPDVVTHNERGLLVPEHDVGAMARSMELFAAEPGRAAEFGAAGRRFVLESLTIGASIARLQTIIDATVPCALEPAASIV